MLALDHLRSPLDLIVTRHAFVAIKSPVCVVDRVLGYPFRKRRLCALRALKKCDLRCQVTIGYDFFHAPNATDLAENSNHGHEHASDPHGDFAARGCARPFSKKWQDGLTPPPALSNKPTRPADESKSTVRPSRVQTLAVDNRRRGRAGQARSGSSMKFVDAHPFSDPDAAAHKLVEIANGVEAVQDGRIYSTDIVATQPTSRRPDKRM